MTIGDAVHKVRITGWTEIPSLTDDYEQLNPVGGQGSNSAIEDAACLANQLFCVVK